MSFRRRARGQGSRGLFHEAIGDADREAKAPNRKDTKFNLAPSTKLHRVAIHQLERQGKLAWTIRFKKFCPITRTPAAEKVTAGNCSHDLGHRRFLRRPSTRPPRRRSGPSGTTCRSSPTCRSNRAGAAEPLFERRFRRLGSSSKGLGGGLLRLRPGEHLQALRHVDTDSFPRDAGRPQHWPRLHARGRDGRRPASSTSPPFPAGAARRRRLLTAEDMLKYIMA